MHYQAVAFPSRGGVAVPGGLGIFRQRAAVGEDLPVAGVAFVDNDQQPRDLNELPQLGIDQHARRAERQAMRCRIVFPVVGLALLHGFRGPGLVGEAAGESDAEIDPAYGAGQWEGASRIPSVVIPDA